MGRGLAEFADRRSLHEVFYRARGDMEKRIKEQPLDMFADRTSSTSGMKAKQLRLWFPTFSCLLVRHLRAAAGTIRLR